MQTLPFQKLKLDNFLSSKEFFDRGLDILSHFMNKNLRNLSTFMKNGKFAMIILNQRSKKNIQGKN